MDGYAFLSVFLRKYSPPPRSNRITQIHRTAPQQSKPFPLLHFSPRSYCLAVPPRMALIRSPEDTPTCAFRTMLSASYSMGMALFTRVRSIITPWSARLRLQSKTGETISEFLAGIQTSGRSMSLSQARRLRTATLMGLVSVAPPPTLSDEPCMPVPMAHTMPTLLRPCRQPRVTQQPFKNQLSH